MKNHFKNSRFFLLGTMLLSVGLLISSQHHVRTTSRISDVLLPKAFAGFGNSSIDLYANYQSWPYSNSISADDTTAQVLYTFVPGADSQSSTYSYILGIKNQWVDINGDGLTDLIMATEKIDQIVKLGIFINTGNVQFDWIYKCVYQRNGGASGYYGDCAQQ